MAYQVVMQEQKVVVGFGTRTTNENQQSMIDIQNIWQEFEQKNLFATIETLHPNQAIGLYTNYEADFTKPYDFYACVAITKETIYPQELTKTTIPPGKYAKFSKKGKVEVVVLELWQEIWNTNLDRLYTYDYEIYHLSEDENQLVEIYICIA